MQAVSIPNNAQKHAPTDTKFFSSYSLFLVDLTLSVVIADANLEGGKDYSLVPFLRTFV